MLAAPADRLAAALAGLDPGSRALLDLSLRQRVSDAEIAELLGKGPDDVARSRDDVLELLADALGVDGDARRSRVRDALVELPEEAWQGRGPQLPAAPPGPSAAPRPPAHPSERRRPPRERRRVDPRAIVALAAVAAVALVTVLLAGGDDAGDEDGPGDRGGRTATEPDPGAGPDGRTARLAPVAGRRGRGRVTLSEDRERLAISIRGLPEPEGSYEIWLYSSIVDARSLGSFRRSRIELDARLPADPRDYRWIDVSHEPADGNPNHSGESVMRVPVEDLLEE